VFFEARNEVVREIAADASQAEAGWPQRNRGAGRRARLEPEHHAPIADASIDGRTRFDGQKLQSALPHPRSVVVAEAELTVERVLSLHAKITENRVPALDANRRL